MRARRRARSRSSSCAVLVILVGLAACNGGSGPTAPSFEPLQMFAETADIQFFAAPGDSVSTDWQQQVHDWLEATLGVSLPTKLEYYKYVNNAAMTAHTGSQGNAWANSDPNDPQIHTIWSADMHETVHVLSNQIGRPTDFFNEGLAVAHSGMDPMAGDLTPKWQGTPLHTIARGYWRRGELPPLAQWVESDDFRSFSDGMTYPCAGSFLQYLEEAHGLDTVLELFPGAAREDTLTTVRERFRSVFGIPLAEAEEGWHALLDR